MTDHKVVSTTREIIEKKLLTALDDDAVVALLVNLRDLEILIRALNRDSDVGGEYELDFLRGLCQLRDAAFRD